MIVYYARRISWGHYFPPHILFHRLARRRGRRPSLISSPLRTAPLPYYARRASKANRRTPHSRFGLARGVDAVIFLASAPSDADASGDADGGPCAGRADGAYPAPASRAAARRRAKRRRFFLSISAAPLGCQRWLFCATMSGARS